MARKFISNVKGVGVKSIIKEYYASTSSSELTGGAWAESVPALSESVYLWSRWKVTLTNGETIITEAVQEGIAGADLLNLANTVGDLDKALKKQAEDVKEQFDNLNENLGEVAKEDIVPVEKGGHGKTSAEQGLLALGGASITKLWGNPDPTEEFDGKFEGEDGLEEDELKYDGEYNALILTACYSSSYIRAAGMTMIDLDADNVNGLLSVMWETNVARIVNITKTETGISIKFSEGSYYGTYNGAATKGNSYCIPLAIYGVKGIQKAAE